jgi:hypothetical protein
MDGALNILQSVLLPFAVVPVIKFVGNPKIMGPFALPKWEIICASLVGFGLFFMNFFLLFDGNSMAWYIILLIVVISVIYIYIIIKAIIEPSS